MKKRNISRAFSMLLAALLAFGMIFVNTGQAKASSKWVIGLPDVLWAGQHSSGGDFNFVSVWNEGKTATVTSVKSSNPKVLKVEKERWENEKGKMQDYYYLIPKTAGKATLTVKYTTPGGKHKTDKKTIRVKKYPYEIKRLKVNGKKISISKNKYRYEKGKITSKLVDVDLKLKKGWQITDVRGFCWNMNSNV